ncbi:unnamed protein product, partial [Meganyctiphanes norvegica]
TFNKTIQLNSTIQKNIKSELRQKLLEKILEKKSNLQTELNEIFKIYNTIEPQLSERKQKWEEIRDYEDLVCSTLENEYAELAGLIDGCFTSYTTNINPMWAFANYAEENQIPNFEMCENLNLGIYKEKLVHSVTHGYGISSEMEDVFELEEMLPTVTVLSESSHNYFETPKFTLCQIVYEETTKDTTIEGLKCLKIPRPRNGPQARTVVNFIPEKCVIENCTRVYKPKLSVFIKY